MSRVCTYALRVFQRFTGNPLRDHDNGKRPYPADPPTTAAAGTAVQPLTEEARIALIIIGSLAGCTLFVTIVIIFTVQLSRGVAEYRILR